MKYIKQFYLSVIVPTYQEEEVIGNTILDIEKYLSKKNFSYEILVVDDGSSDDTVKIVKKYFSQIKNLRLINNTKNHGKGFVVRQGLLKARGAYRLFMDADGSTSIKHIDSFLLEFKKGYDLVIGSRSVQGAFIQTHQSRHREIMGDIGNLMIKIVLSLWKYPDTQCGFKMITKDAAEKIVSRMTVNRFGFDFEMIVLAEKMGFKIKQLPVRWINKEDSKVSGIFGPNGFTNVLIDLFKTKIRIIKDDYKIN
ncbi:MAG: dolichyl-phosphate beta-glucosyltransferase [Patescibacteria group bacterium]|nr:dolichyl-phosphate beta-glucosyltransferase [Patescibacteria group bacterium]